MSLKFTNFPSVIGLNEYEELKQKLVKQLLSYDCVLSVYQMGSVKDPGISDLDLICVFKNDSQNKDNLRNPLSNDEKRILTHGIFGVEEKDLSSAIEYNYLSNLQLLGGKNFGIDKLSFDKPQILSAQIALEYLLKMYITLNVQKTFGIVNMRSFLLLGKAISFDLDLLGMKDGRLYELVEKILDYRSDWYDNTPNEKDLKHLVLEFHSETEKLLNRCFTEHQFYLPFEEINIAGYFKIQRGNKFKTINKGVVLPNQFKFLGKNYIKLQYRLNHFKFIVPFSTDIDEAVIKDRFELTKRLVLKNRENYPSFYPISSSLSIF